MDVTIAVPISDDLLPRLEQKARTAGMDREQYVRALVSRDLEAPRPLDEILRAFRDQAAVSGMPDAELLDLFEDARSEGSAAGEPQL